MRNRMLWIAVVGLAEVGVCAAILAATWGGFTWAREAGLRWRVFSSDTVSVESEEELRFAVSGPSTLDLSSHNGAIDISVGATDEMVVVVHRTAWGANEAEAQERLAALAVETSQRGDTVTVSVPDDERETLNIIGNSRSDSVAFTVRLPQATSVTAATRFGDVRLDGTTGAADVRSSAGQVTVLHVNGSVNAHTDFGEVVVEDVVGEQVDASSSSGAVRLRRVESTGPVNLDTNFGDVVFEEGQASALTVHTNSGGVTLTGLTMEGAVAARSEFGGVRLSGVQAGSYDVHSNSGAVSVDGASGTIAAGSGFGDVTVRNAVSATVDLHTSSGSVVFAGSLGSGPHLLDSDFGNIRLSLPADTRADFDLKTDFGNIDSALPVTVAGAHSGEHWRGTLNGGGPALTVTTSSGNITLEQLP